MALTRNFPIREYSLSSFQKNVGGQAAYCAETSAFGNISWRIMSGSDRHLPPAGLIRFDAAGFDATAFVANGIDCPASIARSVGKRQTEFFFGRLAARHVLSAMKVAPVVVPIGPSREPVWPSGIIGSISHSRQYAAAIALERGRYSGVGIDIESVIPNEMQAALLSTVVSVSELACLKAMKAALPLDTLLTIVFSAKESLFKGAFTSVGRYFDFSAAEVSDLDIVTQCISLTLTETLSREFVRTSVQHVYFDFLQPDTVLTSFAW